MPENINKKISILVKKFEIRKFQDVINESLIILKKNDNDFLWNLSGLSFQNLNQIEKSISCFENALSLNPKNFSALNNLGLSHKKLRDYLKAEKYLIQSLEQNPKYINALVNLGNIKNETYYFEDAISYYKKALELNKNLPLIHLNLSVVYQSINKINKAKDHLNKALLIDETFTIADQKLTTLEKYDEKNPHLKSMIYKLEKLELNNSQKIYLHFGLNKVYKDLKNYKKSFFYLQSGNKLQREALTYDINVHKVLSEKIKSTFSKIDFKEIGSIDGGENNIFILGMPRSGTTLIEKIISSHSNVSTISEANFISQKLHGYINKDFKELKKILNSNFQKKYIEFIKSFNTKNAKIIDKTLTNFWYLGFKLFTGTKYMPSHQVVYIFWRDIPAQFIVGKGRQAKKVKLPERFEKAKIIHVSRNPKDNCLSIFENLFDYPEGWNYDQKELAEYYLIYKDLMEFWNNIFRDSILNVRYEDVILDTEKKIKELISFCDLNWEDSCLDFHKNNNPIKTVSFNQANKPIYKSSIKKYELYEKELEVLFSKLD